MYMLDKYLATSNHVALEEKGLQQTTTKVGTRSASAQLALKKHVDVKEIGWIKVVK